MYMYIPQLCPERLTSSNVSVEQSYLASRPAFFFGCAVQLLGSQFPDQGSNSCSLQWKLRVLTTGPPGNSQTCFFFFFLNYLFIYFWLRWVFVAVGGLCLVAVSGGYSLSRAQLLRGMWHLPGPGLEPVSPALAGGFSTTVPPGKPRPVFFFFFF